MTITIRPIASGDASTIASIHIASWRDAYRGVLREEYLASAIVGDRTAAWTDRLANPDPACFGFIAESDSEAVGFVFLRGAADERWGTLLDNIHVLPGLKRQGIGRRLIDVAAREAVVRFPHVPIHLWVFDANVDARRFYARLGGQEVEQAMLTAPGGGSAAAWRVVWASPQHVVDATRDMSSESADSLLLIRTARRDEVPAIVRLLADDVLGAQRERVEDPVAPEYLRAFDEMAAQPGNALLVAIKNDEVVGCLQLTIIAGLSRAGMRRAQLEGVRVSARHRGAQIGERLVMDAIARAKAAGCGLVQLTTDARRADAHRFYQRLGFEASHVGMKLALTPK